jgi:PTH1 family peptidyl-tRNA hydrolase
VLADHLSARWRLPRFHREGRSLTARGSVAGHEVVLLKPQTYMNLSGEALEPLFADSDFDPTSDLLVLVDDLALPLGTFRIRARGSAGGHNGLLSIEEALESNAYARLRIGIGPLPDDAWDQADYVLSPWSDDERQTLADLLPTMAEAVECWLAEGVDSAMNRFNRKGTESD